MNKTAKRIIAREGLIVIGLITVSLLIMGISFIYPPYPKTNTSQTKKITEKNIVWDKPIASTGFDAIRFDKVKRIERQRENIKIGGIIILYLYPIYLLIRFIIWAVKTLREK